MPVKVMGADGYGSMADVASGITWATDHGARVINMSLAGTSGLTTLSDAVTYAHARGVVLLAAAGNSGSSTKSYPAAYSSVIGVAGAQPDETLNTNSNYGSWVTVAAPWCNWGTARGGGYTAFCGTSSATPAAAGIVALAMSRAPTATNSTIERALESSAISLSGPHGVQYGRVDAYATLLGLGGAAPPVPTGTAPTSTSAPTISGNAEAGQILTASPGTWSGSTPIAAAFQWNRCGATGASCAPVGGATSSSFALGAADTGFTMRVTVTAANAYGSSTASSAATTPVAAAPTVTPPPPNGTSTVSFTGSLNKKQPSRSFLLHLGSGPATASLAFGKSQSLTLTVQRSDGSIAGSASGPSVLALLASLPAGDYAFVVSGSAGANASFTLTVTFPTT